MNAHERRQSGPVAWRWRYRYSGNESWSEWDWAKRQPPTEWTGSPHYQIEPLYADPPRSDASGLIKALERISKSNVYDMNTLHPDGCAHVAREALKAFRTIAEEGPA